MQPEDNTKGLIKSQQATAQQKWQTVPNYTTQKIFHYLVISYHKIIWDRYSEDYRVLKLSLSSTWRHITMLPVWQQESRQCKRWHNRHAIMPIVRLHLMHCMHSMQPIVTDMRGVCPSVCPYIHQSVAWLNSVSLCKNSCMDQDAVWGEHSWGPTGHCVTWGSWYPTDRGRATYF